MLKMKEAPAMKYSDQSPNVHRYPKVYQPDIHPFPQRPSPAPDPSMFIKSAQLSQSLLADAQKVVKQMASKSFSQKIMTAAQDSKQSEITEMIKKVGLTTVPKIRITPDGIRMDFDSKIEESPGDTHVIILLRWHTF